MDVTRALSLILLLVAQSYGLSKPKWTLSLEIFGGNDSRNYFAIVTAASSSERIYLLAGNSPKTSPVSLILLRADAQSNITVNKTALFSENHNEIMHSITVTKTHEAHGVLLYKFVPLSDPGGNATFTEDQFEKSKPFYGCHFDWYLHDHEKTDTYITLIFQATSYDNDVPVLSTGYILFFVTISTVDVSGNTRPSLKVSAGLGVSLRLVVHNMNMKMDRARIGLSLMAFTNTSINKYDKFFFEEQTHLINEEEPGNFKSAVLYLGRREPELPPNVTYPPAYLYWKSVCYVQPQARPMSARRVTSFRATKMTHSDKDKEFRISIPRALFGELFNPNQPEHSSFIAIRHHLLSFGTPYDGFYAKTGHMEWTFVLSMGEPPVPSSLSLYEKLFTPLILPLLAIVLTPLCLFVLNRYLQPAPTPEEEVTRPLIENLEDEEVNSFAQQGKPFLVMSQEDDAHPSSTYGAI
uniref:Lysosomal protein NCU-G1-A n=3 Tax=Schistocephalus solidus TaxID=70667 RepID=A0A0X3PBG2_SCHSO